MAGRRFIVAWQDSAEALYDRYRAERDGRLKLRWHGLWLLRQGKSLATTAETVGVAYRTVQTWIAWYRLGGMAEIAQHHLGGDHGGHPRPLTTAQEAAMLERARTVGFATRLLAQQWLAESFGVTLTLFQLDRLFARQKLRLKVPRPRSDKADPAAQTAWKKGGSSRP